MSKGYLPLRQTPLYIKWFVLVLNTLSHHMSVFEICLGTRQLPRKICIFPYVRRQIIAEAKIVVATFMLNFGQEYTLFLYKQPGC